MRAPRTNATFVAMRCLSLCILALTLAFSSAAQSVKRIRLTVPKARTAAAGIRVASVVDDRSDTTIIGSMRSGLANKLRAVSLERGVAGAVSELINAYQHAGAGAVPVTLHIRQLDISEKAYAAKQRLTIRYNYAFVGERGELSYEGSAYAESNLDVSAYIERLVRESVTNTFDKVAESWKVQEDAPAPKVVVSVKIEPQPAGTGLISYDPSRPLVYEDFKGTIDDLSLGAAATYTGISFAYSAQQTGPEFKIVVTLSAIVDPEKSWMKPGARSARVLAHENLHFAITAALACRLADTMRSMVMTKQDYDVKLRQAFNAIDRQLEQQQRLYDQETGHGTRPQQQAAWEQQIYGVSGRVSCYGN